MRNAAKFLQNATGEAANTHFQPFEIVDGVDFLAIPPAHLAARVSCEKCNAIVLLVEFVQHFLPAAEGKPPLVQPLVRPKCYCRTEGKGRILAEVVVRSCVANFDGAILHGIDDRKTRNDFSGRKNLNLKLVVCRFRNGFAHQLGAAIQGIE